MKKQSCLSASPLALTVRRITINANKVTPDEGFYQVDFFTDTKKLEKEKNSSKPCWASRTSAARTPC